jgi:hypothetical protein
MDQLEPQPAEAARHAGIRAGGTGIIVLSASLGVLHINARAVALLHDAYPAYRGTGRPMALPPPIADMASELLARPQGGSEEDEQEGVTTRRWKTESPGALAIKGFSLNQSNGGRGRILLVLTKEGSR